MKKILTEYLNNVPMPGIITKNNKLLYGIILLITSLICADATGANSFLRDSKLRKPQILFLISKDVDNYEADKTVPVYAEKLQSEYGFSVTILQAEGERTAASFPGLKEALDKADLLVVFARRLALPEEQMNSIKAYFKRGKPLVGIRTANHAFSVQPADKKAGFVDWWDFVPDILGCLNKGYGPVDPGTDVRMIETQKSHPILKDIPVQWHSKGNLYLVDFTIDPHAVPLLTGSVEDRSQPIAWTRMAGKSRVFYTSLGYPADFSDGAFITLLTNAVFWALNTDKKKS